MTRSTSFPATILLTVAFLTLLDGSVAAQPGFRLNRFVASEQGDDGFATSTPDPLGHLQAGSQLYLEYSDDPLSYELDSGGDDKFRVVERQLQAHLDVSLGIRDRLMIYAGLPLFLVESGAQAPLPPGTVDGDGPVGVGTDDIPIYLAGGFSVGDPHLGARVRILGEDSDLFRLGLQARLTLPLARLGGSLYAGERTVSVHPEALFLFDIDAVQLVANLGVRVRRNTPNCQQQGPRGLGPGASCLYGTEVGDEFTFGAGLYGRLVQNAQHRLRAIAELSGALSFRNPAGREETYMEVLGGLKYDHSSGVLAGIGVGTSLVPGVGASDFRVFAVLGYRGQDDAPEPVESESPPAQEVDHGQDDSDGDGVVDAQDECPTEPEDRDGFRDADGCPDPDNDGDGILDVDDTCPMAAEDHDGFEDENGCPDPDNDGDGTADGDDECPVVPGPAANQGCPWGDSDGDGVPDPLDSCVNEPGSAENHGCPTPQTVFVTESGIQLLERVYFRTNRAEIQRRSYGLLQRVAQVLNEHPEITRIRVEGHTDTRGRIAHNMRLSQRRAEAVMRHLVGLGVDPARLIAQGFGPTRVVVENARTGAEHARNRRVEFNIVNDPGRSQRP